MAETGYRVKIVKGDFHFEAEGDKAFVKEMLRQFVVDPLGEALPTITDATKSTSPNITTSTSTKKLSIGEFVRQLGFKRHTDIVLAFGYYLEKHSGRESFTTADINSCYYDAKMESSNTAQMIAQNIKSGRMMNAKPAGMASSKRKKYFVLTRTGEEFIEKKLSGSPSK